MKTLILKNKLQVQRALTLALFSILGIQGYLSQFQQADKLDSYSLSAVDATVDMEGEEECTEVTGTTDRKGSKYKYCAYKTSSGELGLKVRQTEAGCDCYEDILRGMDTLNVKVDNAPFKEWTAALIKKAGDKVVESEINAKLRSKSGTTVAEDEKATNPINCDGEEGAAKTLCQVERSLKECEIKYSKNSSRYSSYSSEESCKQRIANDQKRRIKVLAKNEKNIQLAMDLAELVSPYADDSDDFDKIIEAAKEFRDARTLVQGFREDTDRLREDFVRATREYGGPTEDLWYAHQDLVDSINDELAPLMEELDDTTADLGFYTEDSRAFDKYYAQIFDDIHDMYTGDLQNRRSGRDLDRGGRGGRGRSSIFDDDRGRGGAGRGNRTRRSSGYMQNFAGNNGTYMPGSPFPPQNFGGPQGPMYRPVGQGPFRPNMGNYGSQYSMAPIGPRPMGPQQQYPIFM